MSVYRADDGEHTYQNTNGRVVVGVIDIVRNLLYDLKQHLDEVIADVRYYTSAMAQEQQAVFPTQISEFDSLYA